MNIEEAIEKFAKYKRIPKEEYPAFRERIREGLWKLGLTSEEIDLEAFKKVAKEKVL